ncbi:hypothetical protein TELCIR_16005 [Teladorsagia circumcincta]|uniref:Uncharacterized protein n=1 Tax=Teladorsagia circumcincta TaxID=45464 RepID=A0A2G9TWP2_TELCI|nr:hypothetical protein TELCIR_16005 [Teladorsagia circumcincta]
MVFTLEMIAFDEASIGLVAVSDMHLKGLLCSEEPPPIVTTIDPPTIVSLFGLQQGPGPNIPYALDLNCDFSTDYCSQWVNDDGVVAYGVAPKNSLKFPVPSEIKGERKCGHIPVGRRKSLGAAFKRGAMRNQCSRHCHLYEFSIEAASRKNAIVVINRIDVAGDVCTLKTVEQLVCDKLLCTFSDDLCKYDSPLEKEGDVPLVPSPTGCETESCHELLGPRVEQAMKRNVMFALDGAAHRFAVVLYHDMAEQFGPAQFIIHSIDITTDDHQKLC